MSPVDPISPISPKDVTPTTPTARQRQFRLDAPPAPSVPPSSNQPGIVTSSQRVSSGVATERTFTHIQLPAPSPFRLDQTPRTNVKRMTAPLHRRAGATSTVVVQDSTSPRPSPCSECPSMGQTAGRSMQTLQRQNAMEGLVKMQTSLANSSIEQLLQLTMRPLNDPSTEPCPQAGCIPSLHQTQETENISTEFTALTPQSPRQYRCILPRPPSPARLNRSPVHKRYRRQHTQPSTCQRRIRLAKSVPPDTRIVVQAPAPDQEQLADALQHLRSQLMPLISITTGEPHPKFPRSLLQYHLLSHSQLDILAQHYHQTIDSNPTIRENYPCPVPFGKAWCGNRCRSLAASSDELGRTYLVDLATKRRRFGRFIGLKEEDSPVNGESPEELAARMDKEWREGIERARKEKEEENEVREKMWRRRF